MTSLTDIAAEEESSSREAALSVQQKRPEARPLKSIGR